MGSETGIQWTDATWNPVRGCSRISPGCENCYAETMAARFSGPGQWAEGFATRSPARWTRKVELVPKMLDLPLRWQKPRRIFVNSMSDLFHEGLSNEAIAAVFGVMAAAQQHTFQILTKRAERLPKWFAWMRASIPGFIHGEAAVLNAAIEKIDAPLADKAWKAMVRGRHGDVPPTSIGDATFWPWPLPNVWLGVSVEDQQRADERIPELLKVPAAVRFLSIEPLLGPVTLNPWLLAEHGRRHIGAPPGIGWVIVGGESGPGARPMRIEWARSLSEQCAAAGVSYFFKQAGSLPLLGGAPVSAGDRKGGDLDHLSMALGRDWTNVLRREFPEAR